MASTPHDAAPTAPLAGPLAPPTPGATAANDATGDAGSPNGRRGPPRSRARRLGWTVLALLAFAATTMTLRMALAMTRPTPASDVGTAKRTTNGRYRVLLAAEPSPVPLNRVHRWTVRVDRAPGVAAGAPNPPVTVTVDGEMPQHGHGLPTQPRVTGRLADGRLVIDGMKFSMPGWWVLRLRVAGDAGTDSVTFNLTL